MNENNAAQAAEQDPLSDQFVNAVIRQHGYDSPEAVIARLWQWIGLNGSENGVTLLMYEAHKALSKLRAPVADERAAFEKWTGYTEDALSRDAGDGYCIKGVDNQWRAWQASRAALASAPVAGEAQPVAVLCFERGTPGRQNEMPRVVSCNWMPDGDYPVYAAPQASEAVRDEDVVTLLNFIFERFSAPCKAGDLPGYVVPAIRRLERAAILADRQRGADPVIGHITVKGKGRSSVDLDASHADLPEGEYVIRAALSAQPGAQRTGGSDDR